MACATGTNTARKSRGSSMRRRRVPPVSALRSRVQTKAPAPVARNPREQKDSIMSDFPLPVRVIGPGSQVEEEELQFLPMPHEMNTFRMPAVPESADTVTLRASRDLLAEFLAAMERWDPAANPEGPRFDLAGVPAD